ncbi:MAG: site-2 protease family protein [Oscillospiraceae bacterium]|nr:site-2 protease family protein [Oscillospiraceae bacterium]
MNETILDYLIKGLVLFTAVPVHECAHAWAAEKMGDDTGRKQGRITLNPFAHLTLWGSLMMVLVGFGWGKPVNVDPRNFKNSKKGMVLTSLAGPASNFIMAFLAMIVYKVLAFLCGFDDSTTMGMIAWVFLYIMLINVSLGVFNFLPIPPLDGSKIFNAVLPEKWYFTIMKYEHIIFIVLIVLLYSGLLDNPLSFLQGKVIDLMDILTLWVDYIMAAVTAGAAV